MKGKNLYLILLSLLFVSVISLDPLSHKEDFHKAELDFECTFCQNETETINQIEVKSFSIDLVFKERTLKEYIHLRKAFSSFSSRAPPKS